VSNGYYTDVAAGFVRRHSVPVMGARIADGRVINPEGLELNATLHCNLRCRSCSHLSPLFKRSATDPVATHDTLTTLARSYHASFTKILGGEPLLHPDLPGLIEAVRTSRVSDTILVCTNGVLLPRAPDAFWQSVDAVEVSMYPGRTLPTDELRRLHAVAREHGVDMTVNFYGHFRIAYAEGGTTSAPLVRQIFDTCKVAHLWLAHTVHDGWLFRCPQSVFIPEQLEGARWEAREDAIAIEDGPGFVDRLFAFLTSTAPLRACRNCLGSVGTLHPHSQPERREWRQRTTTEEAVDYAFLTRAERDITIDDGCEQPYCPV
jgi:hypothetical protein